MNKIDITLLKEEELKKLKVFDKYGFQAAATDLAILTGTYIEIDDEWDISTNVEETVSLNNRATYYYIIPNDKFDDIGTESVDCSGNTLSFVDNFDRESGIRPIIKFSDVPDYVLNKQRKGYNGTKELDFLEYPQMAADNDTQNKLNYLFAKKQLIKTGKVYTFDETEIDKFNIPFSPISYDEYLFNDRRFIRVKSNQGSYTVQMTLSNKISYKRDEYVWVEVSPVAWLVDEESKILISKKCLVAGIRFNDKDKNQSFSKTEIKKYIDKYMSKQMIPLKITKELLNTEKERMKKWNRTLNPYNFTLDNVSEEEIISGSIESDIPVFLHGPSSEGKSARVLEIDKDATIIYLANESPDTINGKSIYNEKNNEMIDIKPSWLVKLEEKCKNEPDKLHILFFDEITNAFPRVQGIVFNIILNKEVNGKWKLPDNARIVAAGNEMEDSLSANELSEPLFNRFAHVYIKTTTESWLKWASAHNIHPAIYSFIAYKNGSVLRSKYDGKKVNADPRKWEMSSKMLYKTNNPEMLRSLVGEDITKEFLAFCSSRVITLEDVLNSNYTNEDIEGLNTAERYATVMGLSMVDEKSVRKVREFIKNINSELLKVFDNLWANTEERLEILSEIELEKELVK